MRHYHMLKHHYYCPTIPVNKLWTLVPQELHDQYLNKKEHTKALVIDVTKSVRIRSLLCTDLLAGLLQGAGHWKPTQGSHRSQGQIFHLIGGEEDQGDRRSLCAGCLNIIHQKSSTHDVVLLLFSSSISKQRRALTQSPIVGAAFIDKVL